MRTRCGELDVCHPIPANLRLNNLYTTLLANNTSVLHPFVFAAVAFIVFCRAENLGTKKAVTLGLEGSIVNCLGLFDFPMRPF